MRKIDLKFVFCYISPCNFISKLLISHLLSMEFFFFNLRVYMTTKHILYSKHNFLNFFSFLAHLGPLRGNKVFKSFKKYVLYSSIIYLWIQMSFRMFIFNWNPKNWHYLYPYKALGLLVDELDLQQLNLSLRPWLLVLVVEKI